MSMYKQIMVVVYILLLLPFFISSAPTLKKRYRAVIEKNSIDVDESDISTKVEDSTKKKEKYQIKEFAIIMNPENGLSDKQINEHKQLYAGYVAKRNEIDEQLKTVDRSKSNQSYSTFRSLKVAETFTRNASLLHELYFENIAIGKMIGKETERLINRDFGSLEAFKNDLIATALAARGWAVTCYNLDDKQIQNYLLDAHNQLVPVMTIPLLVLDTYEHAYMIDFGIDRKKYLTILWDSINWDVVEERVKLCVDSTK